jgi:hypothetical protein
MKLSSEQKNSILQRINEVFFNLSASLLGKNFFKGPKIFFEVASNADPLNTLEGAYRYAFGMLYGKDKKPDEETVAHLSDITNNYIEAERLKISNHILQSIASAQTPEEAEEKIKEDFDKAKNYLDGLVANETMNAVAYANRDGIQTVAASVGEEDPTVFKTGIVDSKLCEDCKRLWHLDNNIRVPRVYKLSELREGYNKKKPWDVTVGPTHPHCRHVLSMLPIGYGFDETGRVKFVGLGYDEYKIQHGTKD